MKERNCLLCGEMICGCVIHSRGIAMQAIYGLCHSCTSDLQHLCGEAVDRKGDEAAGVITQHITSDIAFRVRSALEQFQREEAVS